MKLIFLIILIGLTSGFRTNRKVKHFSKRQAGGCVYEGQTYQQGQSWTIPCKYNCQCTDASTGHYVCKDVCPTYSNLPQGCHLVKDPNGCCSSPKCDFQTNTGGSQGSLVGGGTSGGTAAGGDGGFHLSFGTQSPSMTGGCVDKLSNCNAYGYSVCSDPSYTGWVTDNCAKFCGKCGGGMMSQTGGMISGGGQISGGGSMVSGGGHTSGGGVMVPGGGQTSGGGVMVPGGGQTSGGGVMVPGGGQTSGGGVMVPGGGVTITCVDKLTNCALYAQGGTCTDTKYAGWVRDNCAKTCLCSGGTIYTGRPITGSGGTMTGHGTGTGTGTGTITGTSGPFIGTGTGTGSGTGMQPGSGGTGTMTGSGGTGTMTVQCVDKVNNCADYGQTVCNNPKYAGWVKDNCAKTCNKCSYMYMTGGSVTGLQPGTTYQGYIPVMTNGQIIDGGQYQPVYTGTGTQPGHSGTGIITGTGTQPGHSGTGIITGHSGTGTGTLPGGTGSGGTGSGGTGTMIGSGGAGTMIGSGGAGTMTGSCRDKKGVDCKSYGLTVCTDSKYTGWVKDNCCYYCATGGGGSMIGGSGTGTNGGLSGHSTATGGGGSMIGGPGTGTGTGTGGGFSGHSTGCVYNGKVYQQNQTWRDGCKASCTCVNASSGQYQCKELCVKWNLPNSCTMNPAPQGMCCPTPNCPSNVQVQYPPGYTPA